MSNRVANSLLFWVIGIALTANLAHECLGQSPKNIINIILDDADFSDFGFNNYTLTNPDAVTPNLDRLANTGMYFPYYYSAVSFCTPARVSMITGCNPVRFGAIDVWPEVQTVTQGSLGSSGLPAFAPQLGLLMKLHGKATGHFGKWHIGAARPIFRAKSLGFDEHGGIKYGTTPVISWVGVLPFESTHSGAYSKDVDHIDQEFTDMVIDFIVRKHELPNGFFLNFWPLTPHFPWDIPRDFDNSLTQFDLTTNRGKVLAMMYGIDQQIGRIVSILNELGIRDDTMIVVSSDNGGQQTVRNIAPYLYGNKGSLLEGGLRTSMIANWPKGLPPGMTNYSPIVIYDLLPTFIDLISGEEPTYLYDQIDGRSKAVAFRSDIMLPHSPFYSELQTFDNRTADERAQKTYTIWDGMYRLTKPQGRSPFAKNAFILNDLAVDPTGRTNIAAANPAIVNRLKTELMSERYYASKLDFPAAAIKESILMDFDPRFDVGSKEFSLIVDIDVASSYSRASNILYKESSYRIDLFANRTLRWTMIGPRTIGGAATTMRVETAPLRPGKHKLLFVKESFPGTGQYQHTQIYVDGALAADSDSQPTANQIKSIWSTLTGLKFGDTTLELTNASLHTLRLWPDELPL